MIDGTSVLHHDRVYIWFAQQFVALGLPLVLLFGGFGVRICRICGKVARWFWTAVMFAAAYVLLSILLTLPIDYVISRRLPAWGFPGQRLAQWGSREMSDALRLTMIGAALGWVPFWIIRLSPKYWWGWAGMVALIGIALLLTVRPIWIDELTAHYSALEDQTWQDRIDQLGRRVGLNHIQVLIQQSAASGGCDNITSTVEGIGSTRRLILGDGIFKHSTEREVAATIAHELKHYRFDATWKPLVIVAGFIVVAMLGIPLLSAVALRRWSKRFGFSSLADPASLPLLVLSARLFLLVALPVFNVMSRHIEHEADRFALELTRDNDAVAHEVADVCGPFIREQGWFDRLYFDNHPFLSERVRFAQSYRPWERGEPLVYGRYFD
jgi:Zn-dependent protease with chaperone function